MGSKVTKVLLFGKNWNKSKLRKTKQNFIKKQKEIKILLKKE